MSENKGQITIKYEFINESKISSSENRGASQKNSKEKGIFIYDLVLDHKSNLVDNKLHHELPGWVYLDHKKCRNCPLDSKQHLLCPLAKNIYYLVDDFQGEISHNATKVIVKTNERTYEKDTSMQVGLQSILGIVMATSGCPHLSFLKPMARFHLPFSSIEETLVRSISFYLLRQYLLLKQKKAADFELLGLESAYNEVKIVNKGIIDRIRSVSQKDANLNAVLILDSFAVLLNSELKKDLENLSLYFED